MRSLEDRIELLVERLGSDDARAARSAGDQLLEVGDAAMPPLVDTLARGEPEARKAAAFVLGRLAGRAPDGPRSARRRLAALAALRRALADDEPKVRKNAAVALGRVVRGGDEASEADRLAEETVAALAAALDAETIAWVRPSLLLALGGIGGGAARRALEEVSEADDAAAEALRKARDRVRPAAPEVSWRGGVATPVPIWAAVPPGLEDVARREAASALLRVGLPDDGTGEPPGRVRLSAVAPTPQVLARLRSVHELRLQLAVAPPLHDVSHDDLPATVAGLLTGNPFVAAWRKFLTSTEDTLHYRFSLDDLRLPKAVFFRVLAAARDALTPHGWADSPSNYSVGLGVEAARNETRVWLVPSFLPDERFEYRVEDVGASLHPVVAAGLVRLLRGEAPREAGTRPATVFDPTCGSATLLVERARLEERLAPRREEDAGADGAAAPRLRLRGIDASPTAVRAANANLRAAGLAHWGVVDRADAADPRSWSPSDEVIANLPFGRRSRRQDQDLARLYHRLAGHLAKSLRPGGRALLYTSEREILEAALERHAADLRLVERRAVEAGGIRVGVWLLAR